MRLVNVVIMVQGREFNARSEACYKLECSAGCLLGGERQAEDIHHSNKPPTLYPPITVPFNVCASLIEMHVTIGSLLISVIFL